MIIPCLEKMKDIPAAEGSQSFVSQRNRGMGKSGGPSPDAETVGEGESSLGDLDQPGIGDEVIEVERQGGCRCPISLAASLKPGRIPGSRCAGSERVHPGQMADGQMVGRWGRTNINY